MADTLSPDDTLSPAQIAAANPKGIPQAVATPGGPPSNIADDVLSDPRADRAKTALTSAYEGETRELSAAQRDQQQRDSQYRDRMDRMVTAEGVTADDLKPWNAQKELAEHKTDLWSQFGSPGFIIAMLGSAFTAQPMNSALQSGAAAMDAINAGDMKAYDKAFEAWKENSNLTIKRLDLEHQQIADIDHLRTSNLAEWRVQMETLLQKFGDERKLALLRNGYDPDVVSAQEGEATAKEHLATAQQVLIQNKALLATLNGHPAQPGETVTHKDAKGNEMAGGDERYYKGTDMLGAYTDAQRKITASKYPYRMGTSATLQDLPLVKDELTAALGHPLASGLATALDAGYGAKGITAARIAASVGQAVETIKQDLAAGKTEKEINPEKRINDAILAASMSGRSGPALYAQKLQAEHPEWGSAELSRGLALYTRAQAAARTLGTRGANVDTSVIEAKKLAEKAIVASAKVPRGKWVPLNEIQRLIAQKKSSPEQKVFDDYNTGLITAYAATMTRTGGTTVDATHRAQSLLSTADGPEAYEAGVRTILSEMGIVQDAVNEAASTAIGDAAGDPAKTKPASSGVAIPSAFKNDPDGTEYKKDGKTWIKQGGQLIEQ